MRTSLIEIEKIEKGAFEQGNPELRILIEAKSLIDPVFAEKVKMQSEAYRFIQRYGREKLRQEIREIEAEMFQSTKHQSFQKRIKSIFKR